jgi:threonine dehydrogenase-like Zn-dependent dehydrogenase
LTNFPQIIFTKPGQAELKDSPFSGELTDAKSTVIKTEYSIVSPGTELACLGGKESWAPIPFKPGYGSVGRVIQAGAGGPDLNVGQRIFTYGDHAAYSTTRVLAIPLKDGLDPVQVVFARMAAVSITALRISDVALGDTVAVFGLGLVGNLAAQLFGLSGCEVIGIDSSPARRDMAIRCGIAHVLDSNANLLDQVRTFTEGRMCRTVVDATGVPAVAEKAGSLAGRLGELILLGSPRGEHRANLTDFLNQSHLWGNCVTVKGAHEWRLPIPEDPNGQGRFSIEGNIRTILRLIEQGALKIAPLLTHVISPADCQSVYTGLRDQKESYTGVVFDWSQLEK